MNSTQEQCIRCLIQNEFVVQQKLDITVKPYTFFSYCQYEDQAACCLTAADGSTLDNTGNQVCQKGYCAHNGQRVDLKKLNQLYAYCNLTLTSDPMCGSGNLILDNYQKPKAALVINYDPETRNNSNNNTNGTNNTNPGNNTNSTNNCTQNSSSNCNNTNQTDNGNSTGNSTQPPNNNQTNGTNNGNNTQNDTQNINQNNTQNNPQNETVQNPNSTNGTNTNPTNNDNNGTVPNNNDSQSTSNQSNYDNNQTNQENNNNSQNSNNSENYNPQPNPPQNNTNSSQNSSNNNNNDDQTSNSTNDNNSNETIQDPEQPTNDQEDIVMNNPLNQTLVTTKLHNNGRLLGDMNDIRLCIYRMKVDDTIFINYDKRQDGMMLQVAQNNINNMVYMIDQNNSKVTKISDQNYTFAIRQNDSMTVFNFFDESKYQILYLEYLLQDVDFTEDVISMGEEEDHVKQIIIIVIVVSCGIALVILILLVFFLCRQCKRKQKVIVMQNVQELKKQYDKQQNSMSIAPLNFDKEKLNMHSESSIAVNQQPKKLSQLLISNAPKLQPPKSARSNPRRSSMNGQGYNLTMDDLYKKSQGSKNQNSINADLSATHRRSRQQLEKSSLVRSGSLPRFGDELNHNKTRTEESDGKDEDAQTNFGNLVRLANEKIAKTLNLNESHEDSFKNMTYRSKATKSFKRNYKNSQGSDSMDDYDQRDLKNFQNDLNDDIQEQYEREQSQGQGSMQGPKEYRTINDDEEADYKRFNRPKTAKVNNQMFERRKVSGHQSAIRMRPSQDPFNMTIDKNGAKNNQLIMKNPKKLNRGYTDVMDENYKPNSHRPYSKENIDLEAQGNNNYFLDQQDSYQDPQNYNYNNQDKLKIFQSESRFDDYEYMEADAASIQADPLPHSVDDDLEIKSAFNSVLKQQLQQVKIVKPRRSILKNAHESQLMNNGNGQQQNNLDPKERRRQKLIEQYERQKDEDYYQNNNIVFHTGTFNNDDDDDISDISAMTIRYDKQRN